MKKILSLFSILLFSAFASAQIWVPVGNGVNGNVYTLFVYDSIMYAGGNFTSPGNNIIQWNDTTWDTLSSGTNNTVYAIGTYKNQIYVGGWFSEAGGHSAGNIAQWNGKSFANAGFNIEDGTIYAIHQYDSLLYIGGQFDSVNHKRPSGFISWNGTKIDSVDGYGDWNGLTSMTIFKNLLLLGFEGGGIYGNPIDAWNNRSISYIGNDYFSSGSNTSATYVNAFCQVDSNLYSGGAFLYYGNNYYSPTLKDTVNNIAMWNGHKWNSLDKGIHGTVHALASYNNLIVAAGDFDSAGGIPANNIAAWNGTSWSALGNGVNGTVYALAVYDSNLYAGGSFTSPANGIAEFNPTLKIIPPVISDSANVFPNPNTGQFTIVCSNAIILGSQPTIEVYNLMGEKVYSANLFGANTTISIPNLSPGVYLYRIFTSDGNVVNPGKLIIE